MNNAKCIGDGCSRDAVMVIGGDDLSPVKLCRNCIIEWQSGLQSPVWSDDEFLGFERAEE